MSDEAREVLIPAEQAVVPFYDRQIVAVRVPDGRIAATLSSIREALQLATVGQARRIRDDEVLADQLLAARVETSGGLQVMDVLTAWAIPMWLTGIQISRVAAEKRPAILAFRREAADLLYRHFSQPRAAHLAASTSLVSSEPMAKPDAPAQGAPPDVWIRYHEQMIAFLQWQQDVERWRGHVESRLESVEEVARLVPEILERLGPQLLTPEHQRTVQNLAKRLHELAGAAYPTIYAELGDHFHVAKYEQIPESRWAEVADWFQRRINVAARKHQGR